MEDYKKLYEQSQESHKKTIERAISWAKGEHPECFSEAQKAIEFIFPELKESESEDEKVRKSLIDYFSNFHLQTFAGLDPKKILDWLEKQGKETSWKPSKEEMDVLYGLAYITNQYDEHKEEVITRLYQDLKREFFNGSSYENMFPTNTSTEDDVRRRSTIQVLEYARSLDAYNQYGKADIDKNIAWLEKQGKETSEKEFTFKALPRLLEMIEVSDRAKAYTEKLAVALDNEGYHTDAKIVRESIKIMNGEEVPMATMDEQKPVDNIEPKFKVGDWIVWQNKCYKVNYNGCGYELIDQNGLSTSLEYGTVDKSAHLWTIQDAKDGDVLASELCDSSIINGKEFPAGEKRDFGYFEEKSADTVEPKFKVGDWITNGDYTWKIVEVKPLDYILQSQDGNIVDDTISHVDEQFHSFTIEDAKDGDTLINKNYMGESPFIFKETKPSNIKTDVPNPLTVFGYCGIGGAGFTKSSGWGDTANCIYYPATKEQREILMKSMTDAGYEWLEDIHQSKKIEQKSYGQRKECLDCQFNYVGECKGSCAMKRGEQKPNLYFKAKDWYVSKVDGKIHNIYNSVDKIEPKFHEGDIIQFNGFGHNRYTIKNVCGLSHYINTIGEKMDMSYTDANFEVIKDSDKNKLCRAWSEEDDYNVQCLVAKANCDIQKGNVGRNEELIDWLKSLRNRVKPQPDMVEALRTEYEKGRADVISEMKSSWSEEDGRAIGIIKIALKHPYDMEGKWDRKFVLDWLKSLKDRIQPQKR